MVLDYGGVSPNPARDRVQVRLPLAEPEEPEPPAAEPVEAAAWLLAPSYMVAMLVLEATGCRVGELEAARIGDLDETRQAWLVRAAVSKTRRARWVNLPTDLFAVITDRLPAPEDRDATAPLFPGATSDRLRMATRRACRDAGVPLGGPSGARTCRLAGTFRPSTAHSPASRVVKRFRPPRGVSAGVSGRISAARGRAPRSRRHPRALRPG